MKKTIISGFIIADTFLLLAYPIQAQNLKNNGVTPECTAALQSAQTRIKKGRSVTIEQTANIDVAAIYEGYPESRPSGYGFRLGGSGAESVMKSPQFLGSVSKDIMKACPSVSVVQFNLTRTDWVLTLGYIGEGKVEAFSCVEPERENTNKTPWGKMICL